MLVVDEEICAVATVINMRNFQWPAEVAAETFVVKTGLGNLVSGNRIGFGIQRGIRVAVVKTKSNAVHRLTAQSSAASEHSPCPARASRSTTWPPGTSGTTSAALTEKLSAATAAAKAAPSTLVARSAGDYSAKAGACRGASREALAHRALQQEGIGRCIGIVAGRQRNFGLRPLARLAVTSRCLRICSFSSEFGLLETAASQSCTNSVGDSRGYLTSSSRSSLSSRAG